MAQGAFIVVEGIDGAGTTSQAASLATALADRGLRCHLTHEPSGGPVGKLLREVLAKKHGNEKTGLDATTLGLLFAADRADHVAREILPALNQQKVVISDRYYHSSYAYQGGTKDREWIRRLNERARIPDLTLFLRVDPRVAASRRQKDGRPEELFDALAVQERVAAGYEEVMGELGQSESIAIVDGHQSMDSVAEELLALALKLCVARGLLPSQTNNSP